MLLITEIFLPNQEAASEFFSAEHCRQATTNQLELAIKVKLTCHLWTKIALRVLLILILLKSPNESIRYSKCQNTNILANLTSLFHIPASRALKALSAKPVHEDVCSSTTESCFLFIQNENNLIDFFLNSKNAYCKKLEWCRKVQRGKWKLCDIQCPFLIFSNQPCNHSSTYVFFCTLFIFPIE